jgi:hypothetical protein
MYQIDGSSHKTGIKNEERIAGILKTNPKPLLGDITLPYKVVLKGGTKFKEDIVIESDTHSIPISIKLKKDLTKGSFDYVNTTTPVAKYDCFKPIKDVVEKFKSSGLGKEVARSALNRAAYTILKDMNSAVLKEILLEHVDDKNKKMLFIVTNQADRQIYAYEYKETDLHDAINNCTPFLEFTRAGETSSAKIVFENKKGEMLNLGLRLRVVTNNGVGKLVSPKGNSSPVVKIQQDRTDKVIERLKDRGIVRQMTY